jgi:hypothetical protein
MVRRRTYRKVLEGMSVIHQRFTSKLKFLRSNEKEHSVGTGGPSAVGGGRRLLSGLVSSSPGLRRSGAAMGLGGTVRSSDLPVARGGEDSWWRHRLRDSEPGACHCQVPFTSL